MRKWIIIVCIICFFFPSFETLTHTYQGSLWTSSTWRKNSDAVPLGDITFKIGGNVGENVLLKWYRIRLGILVKPITMDYQSDSKVLQVRIEPYFFLAYNLVLALLILGLIVIIKKLVQSKAQP